MATCSGGNFGPRGMFCWSHFPVRFFLSLLDGVAGTACLAVVQFFVACAKALQLTFHDPIPSRIGMLSAVPVILACQ